MPDIEQMSMPYDNKPVYFGTFVVTLEDVQQYMSHHPQYTKANRFKDIVLKVYI